MHAAGWITAVPQIGAGYERKCFRLRGFAMWRNQESALRSIWALAVEIHEEWIKAHRFLNMEVLREQHRANAKINFRNGGCAEGSLARRGGRAIPVGLDLPTQHSQRPRAAPALSQAILSELLERRPGRNDLSAESSAEGQGLWTLAFASSWQTGHCASAIWKFLLVFALPALLRIVRTVWRRTLANPEFSGNARHRWP
jgi:hypothetical protein